LLGVFIRELVVRLVVEGDVTSHLPVSYPVALSVVLLFFLPSETHNVLDNLGKEGGCEGGRERVRG